MKVNTPKTLKITKSLANKYACYVLITCEPPTADGKMNVEMTYEGDASLAAYLLQGAHSYMEEQEIDEAMY